ncbi:MAG: endonuclease VII domain-containing protein [Jatrophihabitantaceae bacterium]
MRQQCHNARTRASVAKNGGSRNYRLPRRYGITAEHVDRMLAQQNGLCAICHEAPAEHVDHDHDTLRVRGLLCFNCNGASGQFRDRTDLMLRAVAYLRQGAWGELIDHPGAHVGFHVFGGEPTMPDDSDERRTA